MRKTRTGTVLLLFAGLLISGLARGNGPTTVAFYTATVTLPELPSLPRAQERIAKQADALSYYRQLPELEVQQIFTALEGARLRHRLNDWLFYQLALQTLQQVYSGHSEAEREIIICRLLARGGFDLRVLWGRKGPQVVFYVREKLYHAFTLYFEDRSRAYLLPSTVNDNGKPDRKATYLPIRPNPKGRALQIFPGQWPEVKGVVQTRSFRFQYGGRTFQRTLELHSASFLRAALADFPTLEGKAYWRFPMSPELLAQLREWLLPELRRLPETERVKFLLAFCRQAFDYRVDQRAFGRERPLFAQELFLHPYSDCEDRVALFFQLVTDWLQVPIAVIDMPEHLTTAIALDELEGDYLRLDGRKYVFCDPTGPANPGGPTATAPRYSSRDMQVVDREYSPSN